MKIFRPVALFLLCVAIPRASAASGVSPADSLVFPGEVDTLGRAELRGANINTLNDILDRAPGVSWWLQGSPASRTGFSIDGRPAGRSLLLDGVSFADPWSGNALSRFLPLSRLERVRIVHSSSPFLAGRSGAGGAVDVELEEGGRRGPFARADFTYGKSNRRARRVWFATPRGPISLYAAYDEYLQDASVAVPERPSLKIGDYDGRSTLLGLRLSSTAGDVVEASLHRYEEAHVTADYAPSPADVDETRLDGYESRLSWRRGATSVRLRQQSLERAWPSGRVSSMIVAGDARWDGHVGGWPARVFARAEEAEADARIDDERVSPSWRIVEGGVTTGSTIGGGLRWRGGISGGFHEETGSYFGGEAGLARKHGAWTEHVLAARRRRLPEPAELYAPAADPYNETAVGSTDLAVAVVDEITAGIGRSRVLVELFARRERDLPVAGGGGTGVLSSTGTGETAGARCRARGGGRIPGFSAAWRLSGLWFLERSGLARGIPEYEARVSGTISRAVFKETETIALGCRVVAWGERTWEGQRLDGFVTVDLSGSLTVLGAVVRFELRNALDADAETTPGYVMPPRWWTIGLRWDFFD